MAELTTQEWIDKCNEALKKMDISGAIRAARKAKQLSPDNPEVGLILVVALVENQKYDDAERAAGDIPFDTYEFYYAEGIIHSINDRHGEAAASYLKAADKSPGNVKPVQDAGLAYARNNDIVNCEKMHLRVIGMEPENPDHLIGLANHYLERNQIPQAKNSIRQALELNPKSPVLRFAIGSMLNSYECYDVAIEILEDAKPFTSHSVHTQILLGSAYQKTGDFNKAMSTFADAIKMSPDKNSMSANSEYRVIWLSVAEIKAITGKTDDALNIYKKLISVEPDLHDAYQYYIELMLVTDRGVDFDKLQKFRDIASDNSGRKAFADMIEILYKEFSGDYTADERNQWKDDYEDILMEWDLSFFEQWATAGRHSSDLTDRLRTAVSFFVRHNDTISKNIKESVLHTFDETNFKPE